MISLHQNQVSFMLLPDILSVIKYHCNTFSSKNHIKTFLVSLSAIRV
uniref:Uncharacterized protein n=1 Tax=Arundo donax TaxID=35708 RepID=A0A0A9AA03_ARUDO